MASTAGGLPEVVTHGETGFLHPIGAVEEMSASAVRLLTDDTLHAQLRQAGLDHAHGTFSADAVVPRYEALYERVVAGPA